MSLGITITLEKPTLRNQKKRGFGVLNDLTWHYKNEEKYVISLLKY